MIPRVLRRTLVAGVLTLLVQACGPSEGDRSLATDTLTRAQKDSIAASLPIPGASGVGAAMQARDAAGARAQALDSIGG